MFLKTDNQPSYVKLINRVVATHTLAEHLDKKSNQMSALLNIYKYREHVFAEST